MAIDVFIATSDKVVGMADATTKIIPGHGPLSSKAELKAWHDMLVEIRAAVKKQADAGKSLDAIKQAFRIFYRSGYNRTQAFEHMRTHKVAAVAEFQHFLNFVTKSERGVVAGK